MSILISPLPSQPWAPDLIPKLQCHSRGLVAPKAGCWRVVRIVCGNCNSETSPGWFRSCRENELKFSSRHPKLQFFPWWLILICLFCLIPSCLAPGVLKLGSPHGLHRPSGVTGRFVCVHVHVSLRGVSVALIRFSKRSHDCPES